MRRYQYAVSMSCLFFDLEQVDYVFTTVPIHRKIPVPIIEVGQFLGNADIVRVKGILERGHIDFLDDYYREEQFLVEMEGSTREEVIRNLCSVIEKQRCLPEGFMEAVMERERLAQTDFGNHIAMPHPYKVMTEETFVYVAVLKKRDSLEQASGTTGGSDGCLRKGRPQSAAFL